MLARLTIKTRLIALVALLSGLMCLIGGSAIFALGNAADGMRTVYNDRLVPMGQLDRVIRLINRNQLALTSALLHEQSGYEAAAKAVREAEQEAQQVWNDYLATSLTDEEKGLSAEAGQAFATFDERIVKPAVTALVQGDAAALEAVVKGPMQQHYLPVRQTVNRLINLQLDVGKREFEEGEQRHAQFRNVVIALLAGGVAIGVALAAWLIGGLTRSIGQAVDMAEAVAGGDLTRTVSVQGDDEMARMLRALDAMQTRLSGIVAGVRSSTESIHVAASEISSGNADLSRRTEDQAASLEETASSMEELTSTVKQNADNARQASELAGKARGEASHGGTVVADMAATMAAIRSSSAQIAEITSVIDGIAFQTNILALNASVEAARAGEQGRGFAVVANEVRSLAQRAAAAAKEIKQLIGSAGTDVGRGVDLMEQTGASMQRIVDTVAQVADIMQEISAASAEQSAGIDQINVAVVHIDETTQQNAALVEQAAAAALSLQGQAEALRGAVDVFRLPAAESARTASAPRRTAAGSGQLRLSA